jgi:transposase
MTASLQRRRVAGVVLENLGIHTLQKGSLLLRRLLDELRGKFVLVYTPAYDPESNRIEWLWRSLRRAVTDAHQHATLPPLLAAADTWARKLKAPWRSRARSAAHSPRPLIHSTSRPWLMLLEQPGKHLAGDPAFYGGPLQP